VLAHIAFRVSKLIRQHEGFSVLSQRLTPVLIQWVDRHRKKTQFHPTGLCEVVTMSLAVAGFHKNDYLYSYSL
jgi:hypothetical protein